MSPGELHQAVGSRGDFTSLWLFYWRIPTSEDYEVERFLVKLSFYKLSIFNKGQCIYINNQGSRDSKYCINFLPFNAFWVWKFFIKTLPQKISILLDIRLLTHLINLCKERKYHCIFKMMSTYDIWEYCWSLLVKGNSNI